MTRKTTHHPKNFKPLSNLKLLGLTALILALSTLLGVCLYKRFSNEFSGTPGLEIIKVILTILGGIGGIVFLVVRFRTQVIKELEEDRQQKIESREKQKFREERLFSAIKLLGDAEPSTKISGVYALADFADSHTSDYKQRVVDILCGYLRTPRKAEESVVETTIWSVIEQRTQKHPKIEITGSLSKNESPNQANANSEWSGLKFNLYGADFHEKVRLKDVIFTRPINFQGASFRKGVAIEMQAKSLVMAECIFQGDSSFLNSVFETAIFTDTTFRGRADFHNVKVSSSIRFNGTTFSQVYNEQNRLIPDVDFPIDWSVDSRGIPEEAVIRSQFWKNMKSMMRKSLSQVDF